MPPSLHRDQSPSCLPGLLRRPFLPLTWAGEWRGPPHGSQHPAGVRGPLPSQRLQPEVTEVGGAGSVLCLGSIQALPSTPMAAKSQARSRPTSRTHIAGGSLCRAGMGHVPCGDHEGGWCARVRCCEGRRWRGVVPFDGRRRASGGSEDRGKDGLWWQRGLWL